MSQPKGDSAIFPVVMALMIVLGGIAVSVYKHYEEKPVQGSIEIKPVQKEAVTFGQINEPDDVDEKLMQPLRHTIRYLKNTEDEINNLQTSKERLTELKEMSIQLENDINNSFDKVENKESQEELEIMKLDVARIQGAIEIRINKQDK
ncbi:MAG: hypothetical protein ABS904_00335 [Solibacillus isronensis]